MITEHLSFKKRLLFSGMTVALIFAAGLLAEGVVRLVAPQLEFSYFSHIDRETGIGFTGGHPYSFNKWHLSERDFPADKPPGESRILALGDSITHGYGLAREAAWPKVLERDLQARESGKTYFCINGAGSGSTTHRQNQYYHTTGQRFSAEIVIVGFCMNDVRLKSVLSDVAPQSAHSPGATSAKGEKLAAAGRFTKSMEWRQTLRSSYLFAAVDLFVTEMTKRYIVPLSGQSWMYAYPYQMNCFGNMPDSNQAWVDTIETIEELHKDVASHGAQFALAAFPYQFQISDSPWDNPYGVDKSRFTVDPFEKLNAVAEKQGMLFIDLKIPFSRTRQRMLAGDEPWDPLYIDFCHPNERGQKLAGDYIYKKLLENGLINP